MNRHIQTDGRGLGGFTVIAADVVVQTPLRSGTTPLPPLAFGLGTFAARRPAPGATTPTAGRRGDGSRPN